MDGAEELSICLRFNKDASVVYTDTDMSMFYLIKILHTWTYINNFHLE